MPVFVGVGFGINNMGRCPGVFFGWTVTPASLSPAPGASDVITIQAVDYLGSNVNGVRSVFYGLSGAGSLSSSSGSTNSSGTATVTLTAGSSSGDASIVSASASDGRTAYSPRIVAATSVDPLIQSLINGDYDNGFLDIYDAPTGWTHVGVNTIILSARLATPAAPLGNLVSNSDIIIDFTTSTASVINSNSGTGNPKTFLITKSDHTSGAIWGSVGLSSDDFNPNFIVPSTDWHISDIITLSGLVHAISTLNTLSRYFVPISTSVPAAGGPYTAYAQAKDLSNNNIHRVGLLLTPSYVATAGPGGGSIGSPSTVVTDRYGVSETINVTAGAPLTTEHIHVTDGAITGDSSDATPIATNIDLTITNLWSGDAVAGSPNPLTSASVTIPAGAAMIVTIGDNAHGAPTATGLTFTEVGTGTSTSGGRVTIYNSGKIAAGFTGTVSVPTSGNCNMIIDKAVPASACSAINVVSANTVTASDVTGSATSISVGYAQAFSDTHNKAFAGTFAYNPASSGTPRAGWTKQCEIFDLIGGNSYFTATENKNVSGSDTAASMSWSSGGGLIIIIVAIELQALP